jgi:hypothetical protein
LWLKFAKTDVITMRVEIKTLYKIYCGVEQRQLVGLISAKAYVGSSPADELPPLLIS